MKGTTPKGGGGRKDRHSKVYTSKGLMRDRRVRLSAHTAIQFYDVQDRLGFDRPTKAVDWLITKAKAAIDKLNDDRTIINHSPTTGSNPSSNEVPDPSAYGFIQPNNNTSCSDSSMFMAPNNGEPGHDDAGLVNTMKLSFFPARNDVKELGLSLHNFQGDYYSYNNYQGNDANGLVIPFQESFQRMDVGDIDSRIGFVANSMFSQGEVLQSNLAAYHQWNQRPLTSTSQHNHQQIPGRDYSDFGSPLDLGFRVPARIYGEEEPDRHR